MTPTKWGNAVLLFTGLILTVVIGLIVWNANYTRPVNEIRVSNTRVTTDCPTRNGSKASQCVLADFDNINRSTLSPTITRQVFIGDTNEVYAGVRLNTIPSDNTPKTAGEVSFKGAQVLDLDQHNFDPGCYRVVFNSRLDYQTWFSTKPEFYGYETQVFCID